MNRTTFSTLMALVTGLTLASLSGAQAAPSGLHAVDWRNFAYPLNPKSLHYDSSAGPGQKIMLHNGQSHPTGPSDFEISRLESVHYADFRGDGGTEAAVEVVTPVAAARGEEDAIYVFAWQKKRPRLVFSALYDGGARVEVEGRALIIRRREYTRTVLRWRRGTFRA